MNAFLAAVAPAATCERAVALENFTTVLAAAAIDIKETENSGLPSKGTMIDNIGATGKIRGVHSFEEGNLARGPWTLPYVSRRASGRSKYFCSGALYLLRPSSKVFVLHENLRCRRAQETVN